MTSTEILALLRRTIDVWVDFMVGGWFIKAVLLWDIIDWMFGEHRKALITERMEKETLLGPPPD